VVDSDPGPFKGPLESAASSSTSTETGSAGDSGSTGVSNRELPNPIRMREVTDRRRCLPEAVGTCQRPVICPVNAPFAIPGRRRSQRRHGAPHPSPG
jgi:hypothetical protein